MDTNDFWDRSADMFLVIAYCAGLLFAAGLVGWQGFRWLQTSEWFPVPFSIAFEFFSADLSSVYLPNKWLGLAKVAQWVLDLPLSFVGPACLVLVAHGWKFFVSSGVAPIQN